MDIGKETALCTLLRRNKRKEASSFKQLEESEMKLKVGTGDVISARAVGDAKLGHINLDRIGRLVKNGLLNDLEDDSLPPCESCLEGKMTKRPFTGKGHRAKQPLELIHSDLYGSMNVKVRGGFEYFISFIDDYSRYGYLYLMEHKSEALEKFKEYKAEVENLLSKKIKILRSDRGGEYMDLRFQDYMIEHKIQFQLSASDTTQQNDVSERRNRTLLDMVRSMMSYTQFPSSSWGYAVEAAIHILNNVPSKSVSETPFELWRGHHMRDHKPRSKLILNEATDGSTRVVDEVGPSSRVDETTTKQLLRMPRRSGRVVSQPNRYLGLTETQVVIPDDGVEDPLSYKQAMNDVDKDQWVKAMDLEIESMYFNSVWDLVDLPIGVKPIGCKWIYKRKRDPAGKSIRILLSITTFYDYEIWQMDVKTTFLNGNLEESIFMSQPEGFDNAIKSYGFDQNVNELCVYKKINKAQFQLKDLKEAQYVLGIQMIRDRKNKTLALSQATYIEKMLVQYSMQNSKKGLLPFRHEVHMSKEQCPKTPQEVEDMRRIPYASTLGSLMYAMLCTRPDICYVVGIVSRYQSNLGLDRWMTVKIILKYLKRTRDYMLMYKAKDLILTGYTYSNFQTNKDSRKSTSRSVFTLNGGTVVWRSIKKGCIINSTMEAEYVAACKAAKEAVWLRKFRHDLEVVANMNLPITLYCDNIGAVANSKEPCSHK
ncbi:gag/pol protein [Cucumis melo var. makuwa]|uniref:Gag/pol protein n=1 Tax=Cucumis melo var. makuwa TaxID=1194695 RepID=A0A5D3BK58_CUCMM|nr:gag/pol protein [Cucumis melo var. makuwa]